MVTKNKFAVLAEISHRMGMDIILVGGGAVEFYTNGWYVTGDLDVIASDRKKLTTVLSKMGFERLSERHYLKDEIFIDIVGSYFDRRSDEVNIKGTDLKIKVICVEDIIIDRLCACVHWTSDDDCEQAGYLLAVSIKFLDMKYLMQRAAAEQVLDKLEEILKEISQIKAKPKKRRSVKQTKRSSRRGV